MDEPISRLLDYSMGNLGLGLAQKVVEHTQQGRRASIPRMTGGMEIAVLNTSLT